MPHPPASTSLALRVCDHAQPSLVLMKLEPQEGSLSSPYFRVKGTGTVSSLHMMISALRTLSLETVCIQVFWATQIA